MRQSIFLKKGFPRFKRRSFWYGYWEVAGKFFKVKSSLDRKVLFECIDLVGEKKQYAIQGYKLEVRKNQAQINKNAGRLSQYRIKNYDGSKR